MAIHLSPNLVGGVRLAGCLLHFSFFVASYSICLPVSRVVSGSLPVSHSLFPLVAFHLSSSLAGGVEIYACLQLICLLIWLVVSGPLAVCKSFVIPSGKSQSWVSKLVGGLRLFAVSIHMSALVAIHLCPRLAGGDRRCSCLHFMCFPVWQIICIPVWLVVSGSPAVSN